MTTTEEIAASTLELSDTELFGDTGALLAEREMQLLMQDFHGVALHAPSRVSVTERDVLPLVVGMRTTGLRAWEVLRDANAMLMAADLDAREVWFARIFRDRKLEEHPPLEGPPLRTRPDETSASSLSAGVWKIDARAVLDLPWRPARYRFAVLIYDWVSNLVEVELTGENEPPPGRMRDVRPLPSVVEVGSFLDEPTLPDRASSGHPTLPSYLPFGDPPEQDPLPSLRFEIGVDPSRGSEQLLHGSYAVVARSAHLPSAPFAFADTDGAEHSVRGVVPITFAIAGIDWQSPASFEVAVPAYGAFAAQPGELLTGYFMLDLPATLEAALPPGSHRVYAILEGRVFGPVTLEQR